MEDPKEIDSVYWDEESKSWKTERIVVEEYHGFTECRYCQRPISHNVKTNGEFKVIYVRSVSYTHLTLPTIYSV